MSRWLRWGDFEPLLLRIFLNDNLGLSTHASTSTAALAIETFALILACRHFLLHWYKVDLRFLEDRCAWLTLS